jgi:hypothetical protein
MGTVQKILTIIAIIAAVVILCGGAVYAGYTYGRINSPSGLPQDTYDTGLKMGKEIGYQSGYQAAMNSLDKQKTDLVVLRNPTYNEMRDFLVKDSTSKLPYDQDERICTDFAADVNNNAKKQGINCAIVYILYGETGHSIVAFQTTDRGLIFVEPQYDQEVTLVVGRSYSQINRFRKQDSVDDTIVRYILSW